MAAAAIFAAVALPAGAQFVPDMRSTTQFRVCADPANAPMSMQDGSGFENRLAKLIADKMGLPVAYTWFPSGMGFITRTLRAGNCDVVMGYAQGDELVQNTSHYYTSVYGIVAGTPPASILARAGMAKDMCGVDLFVDHRVEDPIGGLLDQVRSGDLAAAVIWGPVAGPRIKGDADLQFTPLLKETSGPRMYYRITMGVRQPEQEFKRELNSIIRRDQDEITSLLRDAGVPLTDDYGREMLP
ncbi:MAG: transporter substrate-binding domain-containing protein [Paracoccus sp. (in: a-proteobacteria)]|uniref:transporter substrate-binding domain-containing protein n=1 Tax=Paracoccus sp. TaxID=267 RepID=UPI0026E0D742|nr:transporter substrate-binding domain-containing protein [Paracoccus sp. (in: a-proteobacteria)]MDO5612571.1 transporter substrate-binding domain-containing protein [Paracoccus sp. (in: a-proteobacteria)]